MGRRIQRARRTRNGRGRAPALKVRAAAAAAESPALSPEEEATLKRFRAMSVALEMVEDALAVARLGLNGNPTKEERRQLDEDILELGLQRTRLTNEMIALGRGQGSTTPPTPEQINEIKALAEKVDKLTLHAVAASTAVKEVGRVLDLVAESGLV